MVLQLIDFECEGKKSLYCLPHVVSKISRMKIVVGKPSCTTTAHSMVKVYFELRKPLEDELGGQSGQVHTRCRSASHYKRYG